MFFIYWWKWPNLGLTPRFFALVRNCGLFLGLKEGIAQRKTQCRRDIQTTIYFNWSDWVFESIRLGSDNDKAGGKHCTIWAVTACDFTSESELSYSQAKSNGVYPSPAIHIGLIVFILSWKSDLRVTNSHHLDMPLLFCLTKSAFYSDFVCYLLLIFMWTVWDKKKRKKKEKKTCFTSFSVFSQILVFSQGYTCKSPQTGLWWCRGMCVEGHFESSCRLCLWINSATIST